MSKMKKKSFNRKGQPWIEAVKKRELSNVKEKIVDYMDDLVKEYGPVA